MNEHLDIWNHHYYRITKTILRIIGYWPYQSRSEFLICRSAVCFLHLIQFVPQIFAMIHYYDDIDLVIEVSNSLMVYCCLIANICMFHVHSDKMKVLLDQIQEDWRIFPENNGRHLLHQSMELARTYIVLHSGVLFSASVFFITEPLHLRFAHLFIKSNTTLPLKFAMPVYYGSFDFEKYYWIILMVSGISIECVVVAVIAADLLLFVYAQHISGVFGALGFANSVEDIFTWNFFSMTGCVMLGISLNAVEAVMHMDAIEKLLKTLLFSISEVIHFFIQCYMAQSIADSSLHIQQNLMNARWYHSTPKIRQLINFMAMRSQVPCELTAGKMMLMSLNTFRTVIKMSATYFTVFLDMQ